MSEHPQSLAETLKSAQSLILDGRFEVALAMLDEVLEVKPEHADTLYMRAVCQRYMNETNDALETLHRLKSVAPEFGRAWQEEGHLYHLVGDRERALAAFQQACRLNPALQASWVKQANILTTLGNKAAAERARSQADRLSQLPKELVAVTNLIYEGKLIKAEQLCRHFLQQQPHHIEAMRLLAEIGQRFHALDEAEFLLESAHEFAPRNIQVHLDYIRILRKRQRFEAAREESESLYDSNPEDPVFISNLAIDSQQCGDFDRALTLFEQVLEKLPDDVSTLMSKGHALKTVGDQVAAIDSYRSAYRIQPSYGDAYWSLANLKTYEFTDTEIDQMRTQESAAGTTLKDRYHLCFALGRAFEGKREHSTSFTYYERGNALKQKETRYKPNHMQEELETQAKVCSKDLFKNRSGLGFPVRDPIFIVGLPRAGSTLLEQILSSHSQVDGTLELPNILALASRLRKRERVTMEGPYPKILYDMDEQPMKTLGEQYIENTRVHRADAPYFTDKMPNNFRHIGLIHLILPNAKIIDARREPMSCCFSGFKQLFAEGQEFTYGLEQIGRYYRGYVDLMAHWDEVLPGKVLRVQYEDVVADLEGQVRRILEYCELPFEGACIEFHQTERAVRTASSEQVRQPIFTSGLDYWKNYELFLDPLKDALGPALDSYRN